MPRIYFKCLGAGNKALCCKGNSLALTIKESILFWKDFLFSYQISNVIPTEKGFYIFGEWTAFLAPKVDCPFLKDNLCSIYNDRPIICRIFPWKFNSFQDKALFKAYDYKHINKYNKFFNFILSFLNLPTRKIYLVPIKELEKLGYSFPRTYLELCQNCNPNSLQKRFREGYMPLEELISSVNKEFIKKDMIFQQKLLVNILRHFPIDDSFLYKLANTLSKNQGTGFKVFSTSHIINLAFLYVISLVGNIPFKELIGQQINLFPRFDIYGELKALYNIYNFVLEYPKWLKKLYKVVEKFIKENPYPF